MSKPKYSLLISSIAYNGLCAAVIDDRKMLQWPTTIIHHYSHPRTKEKKKKKKIKAAIIFGSFYMTSQWEMREN